MLNWKYKFRSVMILVAEGVSAIMKNSKIARNSKMVDNKENLF